MARPGCHAKPVEGVPVGSYGPHVHSFVISAVAGGSRHGDVYEFGGAEFFPRPRRRQFSLPGPPTSPDVVGEPAVAAVRQTGLVTKSILFSRLSMHKLTQSEVEGPLEGRYLS